MDKKRKKYIAKKREKKEKGIHTNGVICRFRFLWEKINIKTEYYFDGREKKVKKKSEKEEDERGENHPHFLHHIININENDSNYFKA